MNVLQLMSEFSDDDKCLKYLEKVRWNGTPICPYCKSNKSSKGKSRYYTCLGCNRGFSVTVDTIFHDTRIGLQKWFIAINFILNGKKGVSALQLQREIGGSYQTSWRILNKIRTAMGDPEVAKFFNDINEVDETYVGGKPVKNSKNKRGRGTDKTPVVGVLDRTNKKVFAKVVLRNGEGKNLTGKQLLGVIDLCVQNKKSTIMSDAFTSYKMLRKTDYTHKVINHSEKFVDGDIHTNTIENFWLILKRGVYGVYHSISKKYLQDYVNEFCFRYNHRDNDNVFDLLLWKGAQYSIKKAA